MLMGFEEGAEILVTIPITINILLYSVIGALVGVMIKGRRAFRKND